MRHVWPLDIEFDDRHSHREKCGLAKASVPFQEFKEVYSPEDSLKQATAFKQLDMPKFQMKPLSY